MKTITKILTALAVITISASATSSKDSQPKIISKKIATIASITTTERLIWKRECIQAIRAGNTAKIKYYKKLLGIN